MVRKKKKRNKKTKKAAELTASNADRYRLYETAVQAVDAEIDFVDDTFADIRGRRAKFLREDFCGTANTSCEWVRRRSDNYAIGVDLDEAVTSWGQAHHIAKLTTSQANRIALTNADVIDVETPAQDIVLAMNFSYWIFQERARLRDYFASVHASLGDDGIFFLDFFGGYDSFAVMKEHTVHEEFTYTWDQAAYNPITGEMCCHIHFKFKDGSRMKKAFTYQWRLWTLPEIRELLPEAGFNKVTVYWQGWDEEEREGTGEFTPAENADADAGWICYITAER